MALALAWGLPRSGKGLIASVMAEEYALKGRRIVANYPLDLSPLCTSEKSPVASARVHVLPSCPSSQQLIVLDEAATFLGSREWNNKDRANVLNYLRLHGKLRWDILIISQDPDFLDKQVLKLVAKFGRVRNWGELPIPVIGNLFNMSFPKFHSCNFKMGRDVRSPSVGQHIFKGERYYPTYDTEWLFSEHEEDGEYMMLEPLKTKFYKPPVQRVVEKKHPLIERIMKLPEHRRMEFFRRFEATGAFERYAAA